MKKSSTDRLGTSETILATSDDSYWSIPTLDNSVETASLEQLLDSDQVDPTQIPLTWRSESPNLYATVV